VSGQDAHRLAGLWAFPSIVVNPTQEVLKMNAIARRAWLSLSAAMIVSFCAFATYSGSAVAAEVKVTLAGDHEVPPVKTMGSGSGTITIGADMSVSGSVTTKDVPGIAAHIHEGAAGKNGPVIIPLTKSGEGTWMVPAGAKLSEAQYKAFEAGDLYVNVHTKAHPGGEVRAQLKP